MKVDILMNVLIAIFHYITLNVDWKNTHDCSMYGIIFSQYSSMEGLE